MLAWNIIMLLKYPPSVQNMTILNTWLDSNNELCVPHQGQQRQSLLRNTCSYPCGGLSSLPQTIDHWGYIPRGREGGRDEGREGRDGGREGGREGREGEGGKSKDERKERREGGGTMKVEDHWQYQNWNINYGVWAGLKGLGWLKHINKRQHVDKRK